MSILFSFPGQGAQREGMLHALGREGIVRDTLAEASDTLGRDVLALDSADALQSSIAVQLGLLVAGVASARQLIAAVGPPDAVAGLSIGAYAAAVVAGALGFADALRLVERRATLMQQAFPAGYGMTAILGLAPAALQPLIERVHSSESPVYLANLNAPTQLVIAGASAALARVAALALEKGAQSIKPVAISVPSHCALLDAAADQLVIASAAVPMLRPRLRYFSASRSRELRDPERLREDLARNMARPVLWHDTTALAHESGVRLSIEMPPGGVLTKLAMAAFPDAVALAAEQTRGDSLALLMERERSRDD